MRTGYRKLSKGTKWGFMAAILIGVPLFLFLIMMDALGDCAPDTDCRKGFLSVVFLPALLVTIPIFMVVRVAINGAWNHDR
jgi:hypothetical protein